MKRFLFCLTLAAAGSTFAQTNPVTVTLNHNYITDDAIVHSGTSTVNYGAFQELSIMAWTVGGSSVTLRSFIRFNLQSLPANAIISNATLKLKNPPTGNNGGNHAAPNQLFVRRVTNAWSEGTLNWNNQPGTTITDQVLVPSSTSNGQNYNINVTGIVQYQHSNPSQNFGIGLRLQTELVYRAVIVSSSEAADTNLRPQLEITYTLPCPNLQADFNAVNNGQSVAFANQSTGNGPLSFLWNFGDGGTSTAINPTHFYNQTGNYQVCLNVTDTCGTVSYCDTISVSCSGSAGYSAQPFGIRGISFTNTSAGQGSLSYLWQFGDGLTSTAQNPTHYYAQEGSYQVCLSSTDTCGTATFCDSVLIQCQNLNADFSYLQVQNAVSFTNLSTGAAGFNSFWTFGDGGFSYQPNPFYTYAIPGNYNVCLQITDSCGQRTYCQMVSYCPVPTANFSATPISGNTVKFTPVYTGASYIWNFGDGNFSANPSPTYTYALPGTYLVCLVVQDTCGEPDTCMYVGVNNIGLDEFSASQFSVYPNPASDVLHIAHPNMRALELIATDGRKVDEVQLAEEGDDFEWNVQSVPRGLYFLKIYGRNEVNVARVVIE